MNWRSWFRDFDWRQFLERYKYVITLVVFGVIFLFVGDQSFICCFQRHRHIRQTERQLQQVRQDIERSSRSILQLNQTDSLERFAREQYYMHTPGEDIYLVSEE